MVFYFTSAVVDPPYTIYMGKDKYESKYQVLLTRTTDLTGVFISDEDLIKYGWPEDIWFHVDKLSSAHVYLRLPKGGTIDDIPAEVLVDCAQLVKNNSIQGCKMNNINVVYTAWANLKKTGDMDVGQIGFHRQKEVKVVAVEKKINEIVNRLDKTKVERFPDLAAEKESRDHEERNEKKAQIQEQKKREKEEQRKRKEMEALRSYTSLMKTENMQTNEDGYDSDDFIEVVFASSSAEFGRRSRRNSRAQKQRNRGPRYWLSLHACKSPGPRRTLAAPRSSQEHELSSSGRVR
ncbi:coiled-coil domain-containing protein 25 [Neosynchiropus ocellatus]